MFSIVSIYIFLVLPRPVENVYDIEVGDGIAYLAYGEQGIVAVDISDKENFNEVGVFDTLGSARGMALAGTDLYVADGSNGLVILDVSNPADMKQKWYLGDLEDARDIAISGNYAYIVDGVKGLHSLRINPYPPDSAVKSLGLTGEKGSGFTRILISGKKIYTIGAGQHVYFYEIVDDDPARLTNIAAVDTGSAIQDFAVWESRLYLVTEEKDLVWIRNPNAETEAVDGEYSSDDVVFSSLTIYGDYAFVGVPERGVVMYDISNVDHITQVSSNEDIEDDNIKQPTKLIYYDAGIGEGGYLYVGDGEKGFKAVRIEYGSKIPGEGGEVSGSVEDIAVSGKYIYLASCEQGIQVAELGEEKNVLDRGEFKELPGCAVSVAVTKGWLLATYQERGLRVYSLDVVVSPKQVGDIETSGAANDVAIKDEYAFVADGQSGLQVIDWDALINQIVANVNLDDDDDGKAADAQGIFVLGDYAYIAIGDEGLAIVDIKEPVNPRLVSTHEVGFFARAVSVQDFPFDDKERFYAYVVGGEEDGGSGLQVIDVTDPANPSDYGSPLDVSQPAVDVLVEGRYLFLLQSSAGLRLFTIDAPDSLAETRLEEQAGEYSNLAFHDKYIYIGKKRDGFEALTFENGQIVDKMVFVGGRIVEDLEVLENYAYAADGRKGLRIINLENIEHPSLVKSYPTSGASHGLTIVGDRAYLANGDKGLEILNIEDRENPTQAGVYEKLKNALDVEVRGNYAYVANGEDGMVVLEISNPSEIKLVAEFERGWVAKDIALLGDYALIATGGSGIQVVRIVNPANPTSVTSDFDSSDARAILPSQQYLFVADGVDGLKVFDSSKIAAPAIIYDFEGEENNQSSDVSMMGRYFAVADGVNGARIFYFPREQHIPSWEDTVEIGVEGADVNKVRIVDLTPDTPAEFHLVISDNKGGVKVRTIEKKVSTFFVAFDESPGDASFREVVAALKAVLISTYASMFDQGDLTLLNLPWRLIETGIEQWQTIVVGRVKDKVSISLFAVIFFVLVNRIGLALASGMILPTRTLKPSYEVFRRLLFYQRGRHGPVVFAEDGKQTNREGGFREIGPGFVKVDACSAAVIERTAFQPGCLWGTIFALFRRHPREYLRMRTVDAGLQFTRFGERVRGVADLRKQFRLRLAVKAHTRDGIEVNSVVFTLCTLGEPPDVYKITYIGEEKPENLRVVETELRDPGEVRGQYQIQVARLVDILDPEDKLDAHRFIQSYRRGTGPEAAETRDAPNGWRPFRFYPERVFAAIASRPFDDFKEERTDWAEIPVHVAVNTFRELLSQELYDSLFLPDRPEPYPLMDLKNQLRVRMINQGILAYQFVERIDKKQLECGQELRKSEIVQHPVREFQARKVLRSRGIKIILAAFTELRPSLSDVRGRYMFDHWRAPWQQKAVITQSDHELQAVRMKNQARAQAQRGMAYTLSNILSASEFSKEAMALRVFQALESAAADPATQRLLPRDTIELLRSLRNLLLPGEGAFF